MGMLTSFARGSPAARRSRGKFLRDAPELIPLGCAVAFACGFGIYKMMSKLAVDPDLRVRPDHGVLPENAWEDRKEYLHEAHLAVPQPPPAAQH